MTDCATGDSQPNFSTLSAFVSGMGEAVAKLFAQILLICGRQGLIGREMFAIDGVKLPAHELITRFEQKIQATLSLTRVWGEEESAARRLEP